MEIIQLDGMNTEYAAHKAAEVLARGGVVLYPTDTVYGLAVDAQNLPALALVREIKGREKKKPISIVVANIDEISMHSELHPTARALAERHLPGGLTLVLAGKEHIPSELMLNGAVGVRIPNEAFALAIAHIYGRPYTATSANRAGQPTPVSVDRLVDHFSGFLDHIDLIIDGGERTGRVPSTVVTFIDGIPYVLREGMLSREELGLD